MEAQMAEEICQGGQRGRVDEVAGGARIENGERLIRRSNQVFGALRAWALLTVSLMRTMCVLACGLVISTAACRSSVDLTSAHAAMPAPTGESFAIARAGGEPVEFPPFGRVIARPELFHGKRIGLIGYMNLEFEGNAIYHSEDEFRHAQSADALWIEVDGLKVKPPFARGWVVLEGTFNSEDRGHVGLFAGTMEKITRMDAWRLRR